MSEEDEWNYLVEISSEEGLQWLLTTQGRCLLGVLVFQKASMMLREGFWVLGLDLNGSELKKCNSVLKVKTGFRGRVYLDWKELETDGIPSPIYREGDGSVWIFGVLNGMVNAQSESWLVQAIKDQ